MSPRSWIVRIHDILAAIDDADIILSKIANKKIEQDRTSLLALLACIQIIGEASNHIPDDAKLKYPNIPWNAVLGMRNRIAHEYFEIDEDLVWETCRNDLPDLKIELEKILNSEK